MTGHGDSGRESLLPYSKHLIDIVEKSYNFENEDLKKIIVDLDLNLGFSKALALSYLRLSQENVVEYLNIGENMLFIRKNLILENKSDEPGGKIGWLSEVFNHDDKKVMSILTPSSIKLNCGDRIVLFTDGYLEYIRKNGFRDLILDYVKNIYSSNMSLEECVTNINKYAWNNMRKRRKKIEDDYTVISLEIKNS